MPEYPSDARSGIISPPITDPSAKKASQESLLRGLLSRPGRRKSAFDELVVGQIHQIFSVSSEWGDVEWSNDVDTTGSGSVSNTAGETVLSTGATTGSTAQITSNQAAIYRAGSDAVGGMGVRISQDPTGDQEFRWGQYDDQNGFGWGRDSTDLFVFIRRAGSDTKIYRSDWKYDPLDGAGDSEFKLDPTTLQIYQIQYTHYGAGDFIWSLVRRAHDYDDPRSGVLLAHDVNPGEKLDVKGPSVLQPNLPFRLEADNGSTTDDLSIYVTSRSFGTIGGPPAFQRRPVSEELVDVADTVPTQGAWVPVLAIRKKTNFNGFPNEVNVRFSGAEFIASADASFRVTVGAGIDDANSTFSDVDGWGTNSAIESAATSNLTVSSDGRPIEYQIVRGAKNSNPREAKISASLPLGRNTALVLWVRQDSTTAPVTSYILNWTEI